MKPTQYDCMVVSNDYQFFSPTFPVMVLTWSRTPRAEKVEQAKDLARLECPVGSPHHVFVFESHD